MPHPIVELQQVSKRFGSGPPVLEGLTLRAEAGEFISLIGPSGCGKSTVLRLIAGLIPASAGTIVVDGGTPDAASTRLGFVFQDATLLPWLTVAQNIELPQRLRGVAAARRAETTRRVLERVRLGDKGAAYPRQLSGGQKMRVSVARALARSPQVLLLDEPFGALDEMTREHLNEELLAWRGQEQWTGFFVTHSVVEAVFLSSRILVLAGAPGRLHADVAVPLAYPRTSDTRLTRDFQQIVAQVSRLLRTVDTVAA